MSTNSITLFRDIYPPSGDAAQLLRERRLDFIEVFPSDESVKPYLAVSGFPQGFEGLGGVQYFIDSGLWRTVVPSAAREADFDLALVQTTSNFLKNAAETFRQCNDPLKTEPLESVFVALENLLSHFKFREADEVLKLFDVRDVPASVLIAILTSTLPAKSSLKQRGIFFRQVDAELARTGKTDDRLLYGLE